MTDAAIAAALPLIEEFEGFSAHPYVCPAGVWTIGFGSTTDEDGNPITAETAPWTRQRAEARMLTILAAISKRLDANVHVVLNAHQKAALLSFCYNLGTGAFLKSTMFHMIQASRITAAAGQFDLWVHGGGVVLPGLVKRRAAEKALYLKPV